MRRRRTAALLACLLAAFLVLSGCSSESMDSFFEFANEMYDEYGRPSVTVPSGDPFYEYRHDFRHESWKGEPWTDVNNGVPEYWRVSDSDVLETNSYGRVSVSCGIVLDADLLFAAEEDAEGVPDGWAQTGYPGICPGGLLYRRIELPGGGSVTGTAYMGEALMGLRPTAAEWLESYPGSRISFRFRMFYSGSDQVPEGVLVQARDDTGSFLLCRYFWNVQPGIGIDYTDGRSWVEAAGDPEAGTELGQDGGGTETEEAK